MKETYLKVLSVSAPRVDSTKDAVSFKVVEYQEFMLMGAREHAVKGSVKATIWPSSYERTDANGKVSVFRGDAEYDTIAVGDTFVGSIFTCATTPYRISDDGGVVRTWKGVVFHNGPAALVVAAKALRTNGAKPLFEDPETGKMIPFILPDTGIVPTKVKLVEETAGGGAAGNEEDPE